jgi:hypothetical protein
MGHHRDPLYKQKWHTRNRTRISVRRIAEYDHKMNPLMKRLFLFEARLARLTPYEIGYIAGLVDGEGSISIIENKQNRNRTYHAQIVICNTDPELMRWLEQRLGQLVGWQAGVPSPKYPDRPVKPMGKWVAAGQCAAALCRVLLPHLTIKQRKAELVLELIADTHPTPGVDIDPTERGRREAVYRKFAELKRVH